jgi:hypothetical protein
MAPGLAPKLRNGRAMATDNSTSQMMRTLKRLHDHLFCTTSVLFTCAQQIVISDISIHQG